MSRRAGGSPRRRRLVVLAAVACAVLIADQVTKTLVVEHLGSRSVHLLGPLSLRLEYNSGAAFSIGSSLTGLIVVTVVALIAAVVFFARRVPTTGAAVATGLILGGALGNLSDRVFRSHHGAVVDFLYTRFWPTFNVADASVVCGCILLALVLWRSPPASRSDAPVDRPESPTAEPEVEGEQAAS